MGCYVTRITPALRHHRRDYSPLLLRLAHTEHRFWVRYVGQPTRIASTIADRTKTRPPRMTQNKSLPDSIRGTQHCHIYRRVVFNAIPPQGEHNEPHRRVPSRARAMNAPQPDEEYCYKSRQHTLVRQRQRERKNRPTKGNTTRSALTDDGFRVVRPVADPDDVVPAVVVVGHPHDVRLLIEDHYTPCQHAI